LKSLSLVSDGLKAFSARVGAGEPFDAAKNAILAYHAVGEDPEDGYFGTVSAERFREAVAFLDEHAEIVPLGDIIQQGPDQRVALTFDDGLRSFYTEVFPVLREYGVPATVFVNPSFIGDRNPDLIRERHGITDPGRIMLNDDELIELIDHPLVTVGNHTLTHRDLSEVDDNDELQAEIVESKELLESRYGMSVGPFSYPYGGYTSDARTLVEASHDCSVTTGPMLIDGESPHGLPRLSAHKPSEVVEWELSPAGHILNRVKRYVSSRYKGT